MSASSREQNLAEIEHHNKTAWQKGCDVLLVSPLTLSLMQEEYESFSKCSFFIEAFPRMTILLDLAMAKLIEEAVRRGVAPEQELDPPQTDNPG